MSPWEKNRRQKAAWQKLSAEQSAAISAHWPWLHQSILLFLPQFSPLSPFLSLSLSHLSVSTLHSPPPPIVPSPLYLLSLTSLPPPIPCSSHCARVLDAHWPSHLSSLLVASLICCYWPSQLCPILPPVLPFPTSFSFPASNPVSLPLSLMEWLQRFSLGEQGIEEPSTPTYKHTNTHTPSQSFSPTVSLTNKCSSPPLDLPAYGHLIRCHVQCNYLARIRAHMLESWSATVQSTLYSLVFIMSRHLAAV